MQELYYPVIDLHSDTAEFALTDLKVSGNTLYHSTGHVDIPRLKKAHSLVQAMAIFAPAQPLSYMAEDYSPRKHFEKVYTAFQEAMHCYAEHVTQVNTYEDIQRTHDAGKLSVLLTLEDGAVIGESLEQIDALYEKGVRMVGLTWNFPNKLAFPNSKDAAVMNSGLTDFGKDAIVYMQNKGMIVDVSHLSDGGFWDVARICRKPFVASHSGCRDICAHTRNLSDEMLKALGNSGGVAGVPFCAMFLRPNASYTYIDDIIKHMVHIKNVAGLEAVALGSDFDGIDDILEFGDCAGLPELFRACEKVLTPREMDMITHENAQRVFHECFPQDASNFK